MSGHTTPWSPTLLVPHIGFGHVWHVRLRPRRHRLAYPTYCLMLPMRALQARPELAGCLAINRWGALAFHDADHGDGRSARQGGALAWLDEVLHDQGIDDATGEVWLQCYPRVWGYSFKPVSFWHCHRGDGRLRAVVAEVNNTFGERHAYVLQAPAPGQPWQVDKVFHVSPFCPVEGRYRFSFRGPSTDLGDTAGSTVRVDYDDAMGPLIQTGLQLRWQPLTAGARRRALWRYPFMTLAVMVRIHWHALQLWCKRVPFYRKPPPPVSAVTRSSWPR